jgi:hypothetical protein
MRKVLASPSLLAFIALVVFAQVAAAQEQKSAPLPVPAFRYFSGTVVASNADSLSVSRTVLGRNVVLRSFVITPETVVEGELRERARVTVKYVTRDDVHEARHILVRTPPQKR